MERILEVGFGGQCPLRGRLHNPTAGFCSSSTTVVSPEPLCTGKGHCGACRKKWKLIDSDQCSCSETQTMSHIVKSCPLTTLHDGLSKLHSADNCLADQLWLLNAYATTTTTTGCSLNTTKLTRKLPSNSSIISLRPQD